jgi:hypothetical protein
MARTVTFELFASRGPLVMMPHFQSVYRWLLPALGGAVLMLGAMTAAARGEGYGELGSFGKGAGTGNGQFKITSGTHAFGVDPTDNSAYVGDEPTAGEYRVQKLSVTGQFLASASFKPANPIALEGIAVDPGRERVYVLAVAFRGVGAAIDPSMRVAGTLYAFKTKQTGEKLESAVGGASKEAEEGVLASPGTLAAESEVQGHALLEPGGIAVDPSTHDVIIMGSEDQGAKAGVPQLRVALERVSAEGALGSRYVDATNCFGGRGSAECEEGGAGKAKEPNSPVVSQAGRVYVESYDQIWEIPSDFTSSQPPKSFIQFNPLVGEQTVTGPHQELVEFPGTPAPVSGGGLTIAPEGASEGAIYAYAKIAQEKAGELGFRYPGALAFEYSEQGGSTAGTEIGWTGGQSAASGGGKCTITFVGGSRSVAAGKEHDLFVFDPNPATAKHAAEPRVIEFGPGGTGCPTASATAPSATVKGQATTEVPAGAKVTLSSTVTQANALSVAWDFGDGATETVSEDEFLTTKAIHEYTLPGEHTITETIHTDDLQTPEIVVTGKLTVTGGAKEAVKVTTQPVAREVKEGETATFTAGATGIPTPTVQWQFSTDGGGTWADDTTDAGNTTGTLSVASTAYAENGYEYRAVFTNSSGSVDTEAAKLTVKASTKTEAVKITTQPVAREVKEGETATFTAAASGAPVPTVQWQFSTDGGGTWADDTTDAGNTTGTLSVASAAFAENGYEYRAVFTNSSGSVNTEVAKLTVVEVEKTKETKKLKEPIVTPKEPFVKPAESISSSLSIVPVLTGGDSAPGGQTSASPPVPDARLTHTSLIASASGAVAVEVFCPAGESSCAGTVTLRTLGAVSVRAAGRSRAGKHGKKQRKSAVLMLASGSFTVIGGQAKAVTLHLSAKALVLLARSHVLRVQATTLAHDPAGVTHTTQAAVTLRAPKTNHGRRTG